ncbi:hypothetical protein OIU79_003892 [Salix purpurea]|uniref:Uncharacterized protein n=1 Tax=Salix purpurea TaxID=77065 RepID=A0A9Q0U922_SALPP|nr:hypothetical protein OIU79_003892 [Salix purpurea]
MVLEIIPKQDLLKPSCFATGSIYMLNQRLVFALPYLLISFFETSLQHPFLSDPCKCSSKPFLSLSLSREREREKERRPLFSFTQKPFLFFLSKLISSGQWTETLKTLPINNYGNIVTLHFPSQCNPFGSRKEGTLTHYFFQEGLEGSGVG